MTGPGDEEPDLTVESSGSASEKQPEVEAPQDDDLYGVSEPEASPPDVVIGERTPVWFAAAVGAEREGPMSLLEIRRRIASGTLTGEGLVWKSGMAAWTPAQQVPELFETDAAPPQSSSPPVPAGLPARPSDFLGRLDDLLAHPTVFRTAGRISAGLALVIFVVSISLWYWNATWFTGAAFFALIFLVSEAAGAILEALGRVESHISASRESEERPRQ
jgi:hypothetical protein